MLVKQSIIVFFLAIPLAVFGQIQTIQIPLKLNTSNSFGATRLVTDLKFDEKEKTGKTPNGLTALFIHSTINSSAFSITIDQNHNQSLADETSFELALESKRIIRLPTKTKKGTMLIREFEISAERDNEEKVDNVWLRPNYSAKGIFKYQGCSIPIALFDIDISGTFALEEEGSGFGLDRNRDGKIGGIGEFAFATEIMDFCGKNFLITNIAEDGSSISFRRTNLQNVKIFGQSPQFSLQSVKAKPLSSNDLKGKPYLLDFWATWCVKCIDKMPEIKQLEGTLPIVYFNTDTIERKRQALALADKLEISENTILRIFPNADNLYKSYQRLQYGLPLYVLIDGKGIIRYGGSGGDNLKDLKESNCQFKQRKINGLGNSLHHKTQSGRNGFISTARPFDEREN